MPAERQTDLWWELTCSEILFWPLEKTKGENKYAELLGIGNLFVFMHCYSKSLPKHFPKLPQNKISSQNQWIVMTTLLSDVYFNTLYFQYHKAIGTSERYSLGISLPADVIGTQTANITEYVTLKELGHEKGFLGSPSTALGCRAFCCCFHIFFNSSLKL